MRIHSALGPGLFESVYEGVLERDLSRNGFRVERQRAIEFEGLRFEKSLQTYLRLTDCRPAY